MYLRQSNCASVARVSLLQLGYVVDPDAFPLLRPISCCHQVYDVPDKPSRRKGSKSSEPLKYVMVDWEDHTAVALSTRKELHDGLVSRYYGRVWDSRTGDSSFFRDVTMLLTPPYNHGGRVTELAQEEVDKDASPARNEATVPAPRVGTLWRERQAWSEMSALAVQTGKAQEVQWKQSPTPKRLKLFSGKNVTPLTIASAKDHDSYAIFGRSTVGEEEQADTVCDAVEAEVP